MGFAVKLRTFLLGGALLWITSCGGSANNSLVDKSGDGARRGKTAETSNRLSSVALAAKAKTIRCKDSEGKDRRLCDSLISDLGYAEDQVSLEAFEVTTTELDLNDDGKNEIIAWESSWAGTSGGNLWILSTEVNRYRTLFKDEAAWTPVLSLPSENHGWQDISYLETGGGVESVFITVSHNGKSYVDGARVDPGQPAGEIIIERNWKETTFGPAK